MKDKIAFYLAEGLIPAEVATLVGCSAGYISQLLKDDQFRTSVEERMKNRPSTVDENLLTKYQGLEHRIVKAMGAAVDGAELPHLTKALDSIVKAQEAAHKRANPHLNPSEQKMVQIVQITLPAHALPSVPVMELNSQNEVVAIDNKPLAPMNSDNVKVLFNQIQARKEAQNVAQAIPPNSPNAIPAASAG